jgi:hypothetical protein
MTENEIYNENLAREQIEFYKIEARSNLDVKINKYFSHCNSL